MELIYWLLGAVTCDILMLGLFTRGTLPLDVDGVLPTTQD